MSDSRSQKAEGTPANLAEPRTEFVVWQMVRKYWPTTIATALVIFVGTVFFTLGEKQIYQAEATVLFDPNPPRPLGNRVETVVDMSQNSFWNNKEYYETQYHIIRSRRVALAVVEELGLASDPGFLDNQPDGQTRAGRKPVTAEQAAELLRSRVEVQPVRDSRLARIQLRDASPARAQRLLATLVDVYVQQNLDSALESTSSASDWLRRQLDSLKTDLESSEMVLHEYKQKNDILSVAFDDKSSIMTDEIKAINREITRAKAELQAAAARRAVLERAQEDDPTQVESTELLRSPVLISLRTQFEEAARDRDALLGAGKGPHHPEVEAANRRVDRAKQAILKEIHNVKRAAAGDARTLALQVGGLEGMLKKAEQEAHHLNLLEIEHSRLRRNKENTEKLYSLVLERTKEADLAQMLRINNIGVVDRPLLPRSAIFPRIPLNLSVGLFIGLMLGVGAAFARGLLDRTVKVPEDVEQDLGVTSLGLLPRLHKGQPAAYYGARRRRTRPMDPDAPVELAVHHYPASSLAEAARAIRTNLTFMAPDHPFRTLLVTSPGPSEGKTTVACCIAVAMAQTGMRVLLVDCDLRRPRLQRIFGKTSDVGVTTVLMDGKLDDAILESDIPNLSVVVSGPAPPNPAELLHSERFRQMLRSAAERFDRVILDSPPVVAVTDPAIMSTLVDGTVIVARAFTTRKDIARHAVRSIRDVGGRLAGAVLNVVDFSRSEYKYSRYYYYHHGDYHYGSPPAARTDAAGVKEEQPSA